MRVLGIETSCDETGIAIYSQQDGLMAHRVHSQIDVHAHYGGVVPELASRDHVRYLRPLVMRPLPLQVWIWLMLMQSLTRQVRVYWAHCWSEPLSASRSLFHWDGLRLGFIIWRVVSLHPNGNS